MTSRTSELNRNKILSKKLIQEIEYKSYNDCDDEANNVLKLRVAKTSSYHLTRIVLIRFLAFIYAVAFFIALNQNRQLIGSAGLKPANKYLKLIEQNYAKDLNLKSKSDVFLKLFLKCPTLLWFVNWSADIDTWLDIISLSGLTISTLIMYMGSANSIQMFSLWLLYHSIVNVGQTWYSFGWESQLLESGFVAIFFVPLFSLKKLNFKSPPSFVGILAYRWLIFRIMLGAGLIKIRGDKCWLDLTCMDYHYETQPVPNPLSYYLHQLPQQFHSFEVMTNHFVELIAPFFIIMPFCRKLRILGGVIQILFQIALIISGNLSFLNWLTILPCIACFDDRSLEFLFKKKPHSTLWNLLKYQFDEDSNLVPNNTFNLKKRFRQTIDLLLVVLLAYLSLPVIQNLFSTRQAMNTSFEPFRLVNTYGAFGSVTKTRNEIIFKGTHSSLMNDNEEKKVLWKEYEFHCKPGSVTRRPCLISPYHYRLDWLMWFAAFQSYEHNQWLFGLSAKLLLNDKIFTRKLISYNPFSNETAPRYIKADLYSYKYASNKNQTNKWWTRKFIRNYLPPMTFNQLEQYVKELGWKI